MKKLLISVIVAFACQNIQAQSDVDALRFSQNLGFSNARSAGTGGAFGALGADLSSASINPAGLAMYRSNYFVLGGGMSNTKANIKYRDELRKDFDYGFGIPSVGLVFHNRKYTNRKPATKGWVSTNFVMSMNRTNNFNGVRNYRGTNNQSSMLDYFAESANGLSVGQLAATNDELVQGYYSLATMFWDAYLIDSVGPRTYGAAIDPLQRELQQRNIITSSGGTNELAVHLASNYENKVFIGGGLKLTTVRYRETNTFSETDLSVNDNNWAFWELDRDLSTRGYGLSGNLGVIVRPNDNVRVGASLQTPTVFTLTDEYGDELFVQYDDGTNGTYETLTGNYEYKTVSPLRTTLSGSYLFGSKGFISADVDFVDFSTMRLKPSDVFEGANDLISSKYNSTVNVRVGGEYVMNVVRLRAGFARYGSPLNNAIDNNLANTFLTTGVGIKDNNWALDLALVQRMGTELIQPYTLDQGIVPVANNKLRRNALTLTLTTKF